jgi:hypothetical protein
MDERANRREEEDDGRRLSKVEHLLVGAQLESDLKFVTQVFSFIVTDKRIYIAERNT